MSTEVKIVHKDTFDTIKSAVNKMVDFIRPTFGPASNKVIISKIPYFMVVDDGVQAARDFELEDPAENAIVKLVREVAVRTNDRVGDGTTGALIIVQAIINEVARYSRWSGRKITLALQKAAEEAKEQLLAMAKPIKTKAELEKVARISYDDAKTAEMIAGLYEKLGKDAVITVDKSQTMETTAEMSEGVTINNGYISPYMITDGSRMEAVLEKPYILLTDYRLMEATDVMPIMEKMAKAGKRELVLICENIEGSALATIVLNKIQGKFLVVAVVAPAGDDRTVFLEDIALLTGGKMFSQSKGDKLEEADLKDLGRADRFISRRTESIVVGPKGKKSDIQMATSELQVAAQSEKDERRRKSVESRLARFTNRIAVIKVGAPTENEQKALKYKIEDAVNAVKAAYKGGVVCGSGLALSRITTSSDILNAALKAPARQLRDNMDLEGEELLKEGHAYNVVTLKTGPFLDVGVVDPVEVLVAAIESAVSIASMLLTSHGMIVESPKKPPMEAQ